MLIWLENNKITAYNNIISKENAKKYISDSCIWTEKSLPTAETKNGFNLIYKYENGEITAEYEKEIEKEMTQLDKLEENQLALMEAVAAQYEEQLENRINDMEVQASIYEEILKLGGEE